MSGLHICRRETRHSAVKRKGLWKVIHRRHVWATWCWVEGWWRPQSAAQETPRARLGDLNRFLSHDEVSCIDNLSSKQQCLLQFPCNTDNVLEVIKSILTELGFLDSNWNRLIQISLDKSVCPLPSQPFAGENGNMGAISREEGTRMR